ncbi:hypothetical protein BS636_08730 [Acinetobacter sp. LoGeW2-3]|uniref:hypothetical protein n=1 Tax=Acinetobacter sp. LoGeW2-3 TaxID=1808001 RepID=UPI000C058B38|nr:hypothetical protein [Acinetobacter sp. LoGeW2-3]ATO19733.1 hypothetical protein BS636_08730 [Acinetobacter sp. LoGeW2-3]
MSNRLLMIALLSFSFTAQANLTNMSNEQLVEIAGQGGADLSWTLSLNHQYAADMSKNNISSLDATGKLEVYYQLSNELCANKVLCRLAIAPNNHMDANNNKKWLVFKGIQGTIQIDNFAIDGTTIMNYQNQPQSALQISFKDAYPLKIRNLGFETLSIETGTGEGALEGYANNTKYSTYTTKALAADGSATTKEVTVPTFDQGAEKGFMGLNVQGNLHMDGKLKIFSYNCNGSGRC